MTHFKSIMLAGAVAVLPIGASALSVEVIASSTQGGANQADDFAGDFGAYLLGGTWGAGTDGIITPPPGSTESANKSPWANTSVENDKARTYFSVGPGQGSADSPVTLSFGSVKSSFLMLWGSIDSYNKIEFFNGTDSQASLTGRQLVTGTGATFDGSVSVCSGLGTNEATRTANVNYECVAVVKFTDVSYDSITFSSLTSGTDPVDRAAFEFATVPLPAAAWLLLGVSGALVGAKRRSARRAA